MVALLGALVAGMIILLQNEWRYLAYPLSASNMYATAGQTASFCLMKITVVPEKYLFAKLTFAADIGFERCNDTTVRWNSNSLDRWCMLFAWTLKVTKFSGSRVRHKFQGTHRAFKQRTYCSRIVPLLPAGALACCVSPGVATPWLTHACTCTFARVRVVRERRI